MKHMLRFVLMVLALSALPAWAQWQWLDRDGKRVFSDRAPPADVPEKNILKRPGGVAAKLPAPEVEVAASAPAPSASAPKLSGVDKELAEKKKKAEAEAAAKQKAEEEKIKQAKAENCTRAKAGKATFDSGVRISRTNAQGEREIMDEATRAAEVKRIQAIIDADCK